MLPKKHRLNIHKHYATLSQQGVRCKSPNLLIFYYRSADTILQANVVVPRKVTKLKPQRNMLRRRVMHVFQNLWPDLSLGTQILVVVNNLAVHKLTQKELTLEVCTALQNTPCLALSSISTKK